MTDIRSSLERARSALPTPDLQLERVLRRHESLERRRRIRAGVLATAVAVLAIALAVRALELKTDDVPAGPPGNGSIVVLDEGRLVVMELDGRNSGPLVDGPLVPEGCPAEAACRIDPTFRWSPDGSALAFLAGPARRPDRIYTVGPDGGGIQLLTTCDGRCTDIAWSPEGRRIAYASGNTLTVVDVRTGERTDVRLAPCAGYCVISPPSPLHLAWSPDGSRIASVSDDGTVSVSAADGSGASMLFQPGAHDPMARGLTWGSDTSIVFSTARVSSGQHEGIWSIDGATGVRTELVDAGARRMVLGLLVAHDGSLVWAEGDSDCPSPGCPFGISIWSGAGDGSDPHMLYDAGCCTSSYTGDVFTGPVLSPDGTELVFTIVYGRDRSGLDRTADSGVYVVNLDGTDVRRIATTGVKPAWQPVPEGAS